MLLHHDALLWYARAGQLILAVRQDESSNIKYRPKKELEKDIAERKYIQYPDEWFCYVRNFILEGKSGHGALHFTRLGYEANKSDLLSAYIGVARARAAVAIEQRPDIVEIRNNEAWPSRWGPYNCTHSMGTRILKLEEMTDELLTEIFDNHMESMLESINSNTKVAADRAYVDFIKYLDEMQHFENINQTTPCPKRSPDAPELIPAA